jgi:hypothetical protein
MSNSSIQENIKELKNVISSASVQLQSLEIKLNQLIGGTENKQINPWERADLGNDYYYISRHIDIEQVIEMNGSFDKKCYEQANYFTCKELAEQIAFEQSLYRKLQRFADENNERDIDWGGNCEYLYRICFNHDKKDFNLDHNFTYQTFGTVYFTSRTIAQKAIDTFKPELLRYFTNKNQEV